MTTNNKSASVQPRDLESIVISHAPGASFESLPGTNRYLSPIQVCELVPGMTKSTLAQLRYAGTGPRYRRVTPKTIVYLEAEILEWVESSARYGTAAEAV